MRMHLLRSAAGRLTLASLAALFILSLATLPLWEVDGASNVPEKSASAGEDKKPEPAFEPPSPEALKKVKWVPRRVASGRGALQEALRRRPAPIPDDQALALRNLSADENEKVLGALGRLPRSDEEVDWESTLALTVPVPPNSLNPIFFRSSYEGLLNTVLFTGPFGFDWGPVPIGGRESIHFIPLANEEVVVEWSTSEDRMMDRVVLRDDLTWSDGAPFTARDIEFTYRAVLSPKVSPRSNFTLILRELKAVKAYDDRTVVYFHREPQATNVWNINFPIIPRHRFEPLLERDPTLWTSDEANRVNRNPLTNGPYRFVSWNPEEGTILCERRTEWYERDGMRIRPKPFFKGIRIRIIRDRTQAFLSFAKGEIDVAELSADQWHDLSEDRKFFERAARVRGDEWHYGFVGWNQRPPPGEVPFFQERKVREAMARAFPYVEFVEKISHGLVKPAAGIFHPDAWMADPGLKPLEQDLRRAAKLLEEAGWKDTDGDGIVEKEFGGKRAPFRFALSVASGSPVAQAMGSIYRRDLEKIGVILELREYEGSVMMTRAQSHDFQALAFIWQTGVDPDMTRNIWTTDAILSGGNYVVYSNPRVDELYKAGRRELDPARRADIYREIERTIAADFPYTFIYIKTSFFGLARDLRGFNFSPRGPFTYTPGTLSLWRKKS